MDLYLMVAEGGALMDLLWGRIDNRWSLLGLCTGFFVHFLRDGPKGLLEGLGGTLLPFILLFPVFLLHGLGAGDIKLLCALGAFLNYSGCLNLLVFSLLMGGIFSVAILLQSGNLCQHFQRFFLIPLELCSLAGNSPKSPHCALRMFPLRSRGPLHKSPSQRESRWERGYIPLHRRENPSPSLCGGRKKLPFALPILLGALIYAGGLRL